MIKRKLSRYWRKRIAQERFKALIERYHQYKRNPPSPVEMFWSKELIKAALDNFNEMSTRYYEPLPQSGWKPVRFVREGE